MSATWNEPFNSHWEGTNKNDQEVTRAINNDVTPPVVNLIKKYYGGTRVIHINNGDVDVSNEGAIRIIELNPVIEKEDTDTKSGGISSGGYWHWRGTGHCVVTMQSIG